MVLREDYSSNGWIWTFVCGGSLIYESLVLTAAHCITTSTTTLKVLLGPWNAQAGGITQTPRQQERNIAAVAKHPYYDRKTLANDIALIYLNKPAILTPYVLPVCLGYVIGPGWCVAVEWEENNKVNKFDTPVWNYNSCQAHLHTIQVDGDTLDHPSTLCTSSKMSYKSGGSPLLCWDDYNSVYVLTGVMAYNIPFETSTTGVYVNVSQKYNWIVETAQCMLTSNPWGESEC